MNYSEALSYLFYANQKGGVKLGLENVKLLCAYFNHPEQKFKCVHIAGTNGKGSVSTKVALGLQTAGYRVGLFTSPHISSFRERIQINGQLIAADEVIDFLEQIQQAEAALGIRATFFELTFILSLLAFEKSIVDIAVFEVGIGGRLDATNVVNPELAIITSIALDHTDLLGTTREAITLEKAGIIKEDKPTLIGPNVPYALLKPIANVKRSKLTQVIGTFATYDDENSAIAKQALDLLQIPYDPQVLKIRPHCRLEKVRSNPPIFLDVAHNPDGLLALFRSLPFYMQNKPLTVIAGFSSSKDVVSCLHIIAQHADKMMLVRADSPRAEDPKVLGDILKQIPYPNHEICPSIKEALSRSNTATLITGTFFIMHEAREALRLKYPLDPVDLNEKFAIVN